MKFLHLSDLHIGKNVHGYSMLNEQKHVFKQILDYVKKEQPHAVVIAGDVYDRPIPPIDAVCVFDDFLTGMAEESIPVILISGNHDSPERLGYASRLLSGKRLFLCGAFEGKMQKLTLRDEHGDVHFWLLPFIKPSAVRGFFPDREIESYDDAISAILEAASVDYSARNVLVSHQFYTKEGVSLIRSESEQNAIGGLDAVNAEIIRQFDYVALGHLHRSQRVGVEHIRYAGSPVKYSFSEWKHKKSATIVELGEKGNLTIDYLPLTPIHDMREIKGELEQLIQEDIASLADRNDYIRAILTDEAEPLDPQSKLRSVYPNLMRLDFENSRTNIDVAMGEDVELEKLSTFELFSEFFLEIRRHTMSDEQTAIVQELLEGVDEECIQ